MKLSVARKSRVDEVGAVGPCDLPECSLRAAHIPLDGIRLPGVGGLVLVLARLLQGQHNAASGGLYVEGLLIGEA